MLQISLQTLGEWTADVDIQRHNAVRLFLEMIAHELSMCGSFHITVCDSPDEEIWG